MMSSQSDSNAAPSPPENPLANVDAWRDEVEQFARRFRREMTELLSALPDPTQIVDAPVVETVQAVPSDFSASVPSNHTPSSAPERVDEQLAPEANRLSALKARLQQQLDATGNSQSTRRVEHARPSSTNEDFPS